MEGGQVVASRTRSKLLHAAEEEKIQNCQDALTILLKSFPPSDTELAEYATKRVSYGVAWLFSHFIKKKIISASVQRFCLTMDYGLGFGKLLLLLKIMPVSTDHLGLDLWPFSAVTKRTIDKRKFNAFCKLLKKADGREQSIKIKTLNLTGCQCDKIPRILGSLPNSLIVLDLQGSMAFSFRCRHQEVKKLAEGFTSKRLSAVRSLNLSGAIERTNLEVLCRELRLCKPIVPFEHLFFADNDWNAHGIHVAHELSHFFRAGYARALQTLVLDNCRIPGPGVNSICGALEVASRDPRLPTNSLPLTTLSLKGNGEPRFARADRYLSSSVVTVIREKILPDLQNLDLANCDISPLGLIAFGEAMAERVVGNLKTLDVRGNNLRDSQTAGQALAGGMVASAVPDLSKVTLWERISGTGHSEFFKYLLTGTAELPPKLDLRNMEIEYLPADLATLLLSSRWERIPNFSQIQVSSGNGVAALLAAVTAAPIPFPIPELAISNFSPSSEQANQMSTCFKWAKLTQPLTSLQISMGPGVLTAEDRLALFESFKECSFPKLTELIVKKSHVPALSMQDEDVVALVEAFKEGTLSAVETLGLSGEFGVVGVKALVGEAGQTYLSRIVTLRLAESQAGSLSSVRVLSRALSDGRLSRLRELDLGQTGLTDAGLRTLTRAAKADQFPSLEVLNLRENKLLTCSPIKFLRTTLKNCPACFRSLSSLILNGCDGLVGDAGEVLFDIVSSGERLPSLEKLQLEIVEDLAYNSFFEKVTKEVKARSRSCCKILRVFSMKTSFAF
uniref:Uncharacterized protein n=1 Tax=Chromera velia CCMP2878 TaxID=1169474 RepID=A0A0G4H8G6_9ALVE|eukprot:Cvel_25157.t1-p1 / transcript=Cvel_25157.t1 / gene=Cvel_25157 / organism=Chromera_velia_CCMP2878 / gene_product=hypothetical protein / transcript_product=hypothetical protein / location=Cvel_scaffold2814:11157-16493(+) / protein_length=788 / sequence_SO=supercontig / SO=protein_coding / is_pseudo=false